MIAPKPEPLSVAEREKIKTQIAELAKWEQLTRLGKPGINQLRGHIRGYLAELRMKLEFDTASE